MLKIVCNSSSINDVKNSSHTLHDLGMLLADDEKIDRVLGVVDANLLRASLQLNRSSDKTLIVRHKILWSHTQGNLNLGDSSIITGAMSCILA